VKLLNAIFHSDKIVVIVSRATFRCRISDYNRFVNGSRVSELKRIDKAIIIAIIREARRSARYERVIPRPRFVSVKELCYI